MSSEEFEKYDNLSDPSLDGSKSDELDEYGVWIKKRPNASFEESSSEASFDVSDVSEDTGTSESLAEGDVFGNASSNADSAEDSTEEEAFDFDGLNDDVGGDSLSDSSTGEKDLDDVDMSDFFTDFGSDGSDEDAETEDTLKMDLNFDTVDSFEQNDKDDFDSMLSEAESSDTSLQGALTEESFIQDSEFDDLLSSDSSSSSSSSMHATAGGDVESHDISLDVDVDEEQSFDKLSDGEASVVIDSPVDSIEGGEDARKDDEDDIVIKNTVIEATNIDEIKSKNQEVLNENEKDISLENTQKGNVSMEDFNDVDALAKDLAEGVASVASVHSTGSLQSNVVSVEGLDKVAELLQGMAKELTSIKEEIVSLKEKVSLSYREKSEKDVTASCSAEEKGTEHEESGFFKDEDTDEAIALTGDELNNILITADFTEEEAGNQNIEGDAENQTDESDVTEDEDVSGKESEDVVGACEACSEDEKNIEDEGADFDSDRSDFEFDDIAIENSKLDDFVIPEELDYNMLDIEDGNASVASEDEVASVSDSDMAYLNEKDDLPQTQELSTKGDDISSCEDTSSAEKASSVDKSEDEEMLPANIKKDIKSVLAYMDQLLESLPEEKIKEFAESEYFEMYHRLFNELGIS